MKRILIFIAIVLVIVVIAAIATFVIRRTNTPSGAGTAQTGNPFQFASSTGSVGQGRTLTFSDGSQANVPEFLAPNQPSWASAQYGYQVTSDDSKPYHILFYPDNSSFLISLSTEPLGESRLAAEAELKQRLRLSEEALCQLSVQVKTSIDVNEAYAGENLGLSFCPGSVKLP